MAFGRYATALRANEMSPTSRLARAIVLESGPARRPRHLIATCGFVVGPMARLHLDLGLAEGVDRAGEVEVFLRKCPR